MICKITNFYRIFFNRKKFVKFVKFYEWKKFVKFEFSIYASLTALFETAVLSVDKLTVSLIYYYCQYFSYVF